MANYPAAALVLQDGDREQLASWARSTATRAGLVMRARILLLAADGVANARIAAMLGTTPTSVWKWRKRYAQAGLAGLADAPRSGRPRLVDPRPMVSALTLDQPMA